MTTYADEQAAISRTPITLLVLDLDYCTRTFGASPCLATGTKCYNTRGTCRYPAAYDVTTRQIKISSANAPVPFDGARPYLKSVSYNPTEIKSAGLTVNGRATVECYDEPDDDIGIDPYLADRTAAPAGTYWRKLVARNPHVQGRTAHIYEGYLGMTEADFLDHERWVGAIDNVTLNPETAKVEVVDLLKAINKIDVPPKLDIKLVTDIDTTAATITLSDITGLDSPAGWFRVGDEIIAYTGLNGTNNQATGCTRGAFGTTAEEHDASDKVQKVRVYPAGNPFEILYTMLITDAGMSTAQVATTAFEAARDVPGGEINMRAIIAEPTKLSDLYFELVDLLDCKSWVGEDLKITIRRNLPNAPGRTTSVLTGEANIVQGSTAVDLNQKSRLSRVLLYWDKPVLVDVDEYEKYNRLDVAIDSDAESAAEYGEPAEKIIGCRWLHPDLATEEALAQFIANHVRRRVRNQRDPLPIVSVQVERKDAGILTGAYVDLTTDALQDLAGASLRGDFEVVKRQERGNVITLSLLRCNPRRILIVAPSDFPDSWADGTVEQQRYGAICSSQGLMSDGSPGSTVY